MGTKENKGRKIGAVDYFAFACMAAAGIIPQYLLSSFASAYYTDVALVPAAAIGSVILIMRFTDGISDLIMGGVIDHTNTRWGKCRPWMLTGTIGLVITSISIFHAPGTWGTGAKVAWFAVSYFLMMTIFATMQGVAGTTLMVYITHDPQERTKFGAANMAGVYIGGIIATTVTTILLGIWGYTQSGYDKTLWLYAAILLICGIFSVIRLQEKGTASDGTKKSEEKNAPLREVLTGMVKNKYYIYAVIAGLLINLTNGITTGMGVYFCRDIFHNAGLYAAVTLTTIFPTLLALPIAVGISKKLGNYRTLAYGRAGFMVGLAIASAGLLTSNSAIFLFGQGFGGVCGSTFAACFTATLANTVDYSEYKFRTNGSGVMMSATSFCNKVGLGLGSAVTGVILTIARYSGEAAAAGTAQSAYTVSVERWAMIFLPLCLNLIVTILLFMCNIDKHMPEVQAELSRRRGE